MIKRSFRAYTYPDIRDKSFAPTWISTFMVDSSMFTNILRTLLFFNWTTVFMIRDTSANSAAFFGALTNATEKLCKLYNIQVTVRDVDSKSPIDYKSILGDFSTKGRGIPTARVVCFLEKTMISLELND